MTDPKRWNDTDDDDDARRLVTTLAKAEPTATMRESVWAKVAATLPTGPGSGGPNDAGSAGGAGGAGAKGGAALGTGAKLLIAAALGAGALSLWVVMRTEAPATPAPPAPSIAMSAPVPPTAPAPPPPTEPSTPSASVTAAALAPSVLLRPTSAAPSPVAHASSAPSSSSTATLAADRLREEAEGVKRARQLLRDKNPAGALSELDRLGRLFPSGPLEEEREVLTIEALIGSSGTADLGHRRAERFLAERPQSVHAVRVRGLAGR